MASSIFSVLVDLHGQADLLLPATAETLKEPQSQHWVMVHALFLAFIYFVALQPDQATCGSQDTLCAFLSTMDAYLPIRLDVCVRADPLLLQKYILSNSCMQQPP